MAEKVKKEGDFKVKAPKEESKQENPAVGVTEEGNITLDLNKLKDEPKQEKPEKEEPKKEEITNETDTADKTGVDGSVEAPDTAPEQEEVLPEKQAQEPETVLEEVLESEEVKEIVEEVKEEVVEAIEEAKETGKPLPENIQKVVDFIEDTGGSLEDYVKLNTDYDKLNEDQLLAEYYQTSKPHLNLEEVNFLMQDKFAIDENEDSEKDIKKKQIARKEELASAKQYLDGLKSKYYAEIKAGSNLLPEQKKAVDFFNRYTKETEEATQLANKQAKVFLNKTDNVFNDQFKGFDYKVGDKTYRYKVKDTTKVKDSQSDINNFVKKFLDKDNQMSDAAGYHKSLFTAMNADQVAQHFYEQGKADAMQDSIAKSKNVKMGARGVHEDVKLPNQWTVRSVESGAADSKLKIKTFKHTK